ncbi:hypothetical protein HDU91_004436, partial [Kappamyces sp. JEL0680]
ALQSDYDKIKQSYQVEKDVNSELIASVQGLKSEINKLSSQFTQLSNDAEVALAAERVAMDRLDEQDRLVRERGFQISTLNQELDRITKDRNSLEREYHAIRKAYEALEKVQTSSLEPLAIFETQWAKERKEFYEENTVLKGSLHFLESENRLLRSDLEDKVSSLPDAVTHAHLIAETSLSREKIKKLETKINSQAGEMATLEAKIVKLETQLDAKAKQAKDLAFSLNFYKQDAPKKESMLKDVQERLRVLQGTIAATESKAKLEASINQSKELLVRDCKAKIKDLEEKVEKYSLEQKALQDLQASVKDHKLEIQRKNDVVKHWKT